MGVRSEKKSHCSIVDEILLVLQKPKMSDDNCRPTTTFCRCRCRFSEITTKTTKKRQFIENKISSNYS